MAALRLKKIYNDGNFKISVFSNSRVILKLIDNFFDFRRLHVLSPKIKMSCYLEDVSGDKKNKRMDFIYRDVLDKDDNLISAFGSKTTAVMVDPRRAVVNATIFDCRESIKENILDSIISRPLRFIMAYRGFFFLHASVVARGGDCIIINGAQNSGKSTIALTLAKSGFDFLTDDDCYVKSDGRRDVLLPFSTKIGLNEEILSKNNALKKYTLKNYYYGKKSRLSAWNIFKPCKLAKTYNCKLILFPRYKAKCGVSLKRVSQGDAINRLFRDMPIYMWQKRYKNMPEETLKNLCNFIKEAQVFELIYNDGGLEEIAGLIEEKLR
ncbi:MAG: hypothetical protein PHV48_02255 [Candidatus Omnitrophica bacterium]|nr:hypothetical protein [Candidatus Omnitrophota bacterium]